MATYDYASKGLANGIGIPALVLGSLGFLNSGGLGGILGGGCNNNATPALMSENSQLKATIDSYKNTSDVYTATRNEIEALSNRLLTAYINPMATEISNNRVEMARQEEQIKCLNKEMCLREQIMNGKIDQVALISNNGLTALQGQVNCLAQTVNSISKIVVPNTAICPGWGNVTVTPATTTTT